MSFPFNALHGPVIVEASLSGPQGQADLRLILDTGATTSLIRSTLLVALGYDPDASPDPLIPGDRGVQWRRGYGRAGVGDPASQRSRS